MPLFTDFEKSTYQDWINRLKQDLKTENPEEIVIRKIEEMMVPAYFSHEQFPEKIRPLLNRTPHNPEFAFSNDWETCVSIPAEDPATANKLSLQMLELGATSIRFNGSGISGPEELKQCLQGIIPEIIRIHIDCGEASPSLLFLMHDEMQNKKSDLSGIRGSIGFDPFGDFAFRGYFDSNLQESMAILKSMLDFQKKHLPAFNVLSINGATWHNAGATATQELAFILSSMADYMVRSGLGENLTRSTQLRMAAGSEYFLNIAKFRSIRILWKRMLGGFNNELADIPLYLNTETALRNKTCFDPWNNILRASTESMSAITGGTDEHTVHPHDVIFAEPDFRSLRLAMNIQHMLKYEAHLDKVHDVSAGSYYIENLTAQLTESAWDLFLETESQGGFLESLKKGFIQDHIRKSREEKEKTIRTGKKPIIGVSAFADPAERETIVTIPSKSDFGSKKPEIIPVEPFREASAFETLRIQFQSISPSSLFLAMLENPEKSRQRANFCSDFMAIAGLNTSHQRIGISLDDQLKSQVAADASVIILCGADEDYLPAMEKLKGHNVLKKTILIVGKPKNTDNLKAAGVSDFIFPGIDAPAFFLRLRDVLIPRK